MTIRIQPAPVRRSVTVKALPDKAFAVFTAGIHRWWPKTHSIGKSPQADVKLEPKAGGRWYEVGADGSTCDWGRVLVWEPPHRLVLAWQLNADWAYDADLVTEVEVRFTALADGGTQVDLEHRDLERLGDKAEMARASFDSDGGWVGLLVAFASVAAD